jgi:hypothetical protein
VREKSWFALLKEFLYIVTILILLLRSKKVIFNVSYKTVWSRSRKKYFWAPQYSTPNFRRQQVMCPLQDLANEELQGSLASEALALLSSSTGAPAPAPADSVQDSGRQRTRAVKNRISVHI